MKCEEMIKEVYSVAGKLEGLSLHLTHYCNEAVVAMVIDCVDRLEIIGAQLIKQCNQDVEIMIPTNEQLLDFLGEKRVNTHDEIPQEAFGRVYPGQEDTSDQ